MTDEPKNQIKQIPRAQRRVLGVLMEKAFTTPEQYPLTLKAVTTGCNQKSNRSPVVSYSEGEVQDSLDALREDLLCAEVFTDGGRAPRYRHYMRHKFDFSEAQFAIIAELMLRGRQQLGELRTRAGRMVRIESLDALRTELQGLQQMGYLQASGSLERRGIEVDHTLYTDKEASRQPAMMAPALDDTPSAAPPPAQAAAQPAAAIPQASSGELEELRTLVKEQAEEIRQLASTVSDLEDRLQKLERDLGM